MNRNPLSMFGNMSYVPGVGYVQVAGASGGGQRSLGALAGEADVMMISGVGSMFDAAGKAAASAANTAISQAQSDVHGNTLSDVQRIINSVPWWGWLLIGAAAFGVAATAIARSRE